MDQNGIVPILFPERHHCSQNVRPKLLDGLVDLVGIEPTTSSMPWNWQNRKLLKDKVVKIGGVGKNRQNRHGLTPI